MNIEYWIKITNLIRLILILNINKNFKVKEMIELK